MLTGITVSAVLLWPLLEEFWKDHWQKLAGGILALSVLFYLAPASPQLKKVMQPISELPQTLRQAVAGTNDGIAKLKSEYYNAFHQ
jgi:hypothetical protein